MFKLLKSLYLTQRFFTAIVALAFLFLLSYWYPGLYGIVWILILAFLVINIAELSMLYSKEGFAATRILPERFSNSDVNYVLIKLKNSYDFKVNIHLIDELPVQFQKRDFLIKVQLNGKQQKTVTYDVRPVDRGVYYFGSLNCFVSSPVFLLKRRYTFNTNQAVKVFPSFIQMKKYDFLAIDSKLGLFGLKKIRRIGHTMEFEQIKEYVSGDDLRTINWNATAKKSQLMVNQYQDQKMQPIYSIIDSSRVMKMPFNELKLVDYAINSALAFSNIALKKGDKVGLIEFSNKINKILPAQAKRTYLNNILNALYNVDTNFLDSDYGLLQATIKRSVNQRSLILLYTNFEHITSLHRQINYLKAIAKSHVLVVIFFENTELTRLAEMNVKNKSDIYDQTIAQQFQFDKKLIVKELHQKGIQTILTTPENLTVNTINKYLEIKAKGLL
jgi:uncharacterized protein (DUF58 family)